MKSQKHNLGELKSLTVNIEKKVVDDILKMAKMSGMPLDEIVVIALKRFRTSHGDYVGNVPQTE